METPDRIVVIALAVGAAVAGVVGAMAGAGMRVEVRTEQDLARAFIGTEEVFTTGAPAYPAWAPEPLYPEAQPDPSEAFDQAWDDAMSGRRDIGEPVRFEPPQDLPPPYQVVLESERRAQPPQPQSAAEDKAPGPD